MKNLGTCRHADGSGIWDISKPVNENQFDINEKKVPLSSRGIWKILGTEGPICTAHRTREEQIEKKGGFFFCDIKRERECLFYDSWPRNVK